MWEAVEATEAVVMVLVLVLVLVAVAAVMMMNVTVATLAMVLVELMVNTITVLAMVLAMVLVAFGCKVKSLPAVATCGPATARGLWIHESCCSPTVMAGGMQPRQRRTCGTQMASQNIWYDAGVGFGRSMWW